MHSLKTLVLAVVVLCVTPLWSSAADIAAPAAGIGSLSPEVQAILQNSGTNKVVLVVVNQQQPANANQFTPQPTAAPATAWEAAAKATSDSFLLILLMLFARRVMIIVFAAVVIMVCAFVIIKMLKGAGILPRSPTQ